MNNKRTFDIISISSEDEDDVPLKVLGTPPLNPAVTNNLKTYTGLQQCEFCDEVFLNKFDILVHNAKHIIIPLLKQNVHQCTECLYHFTSEKELNHHMQQKHNIKLQSVISDKLKTELGKIEANKCKVKLEDFTKADVKFLLGNSLKTESGSNEKKVAETERKPQVDKARSRLTFEDDVDDCTDFVVASKGLLCDLTKECKVNINLFDKPLIAGGDDIVDASVAPKTADKCSGTPMDDVDEVFTASVHYDELVKPGKYRCRRCAELFTTRFQLIQHDMHHIKVRKPRPLLCEFCERFISNAHAQLRRHMVAAHSADLWRHKQRPHTTCHKCGLTYYNYTKHMNNYHDLLYCHLCNQGFDTDEERLDHIREHLVETKCLQCDLVSTAIEIQEHQRLCHRVSNVSTIKICETCCLFVKNKHNMQYIFLETISELGTRLSCERCGKKFFELKLVRRLHKGKEREKFEGEREKKKYLSNTDRLKNIQQRLKMINKLSRF